MKSAIFRAVLLALAVQTLAAPIADTVYITRTGKKYHRDKCRHLISRIPVERADGIRRGYDPCKVCRH